MVLIPGITCSLEARSYMYGGEEGGGERSGNNKKVQVQQMNSVSQNWDNIFTDADWDTRFYWARHGVVSSTSL